MRRLRYLRNKDQPLAAADNAGDTRKVSVARLCLEKDVYDMQ